MNKRILKRASKLLRWETLLVVLLVVLWIVFNNKDAALQAERLALIAKKGRGKVLEDVINVPNMLDGMGPYLLYSFMALGMALLLGMGDIDISVGATAALSASVMGLSYGALVEVCSPGLAMAAALVLCILTGAACGALNGILVTRFRELFPMIITLGTQLFYRGLCYLLLGGDTLKYENDGTWGMLADMYNGKVALFGCSIPTMLILFLGLALVFFVFFHLTTGGRKLFAIGTNRVTALYSGVRVDRFELAMFTLCGIMAAVSSMFYVGSVSATVRADAMVGYEMYAIAVVVLGGFSTNGGKGNVIGIILSVLIFAVMKKGLGTVYKLPDSTVNLAVGVVLILSSALPNLLQMLRTALRLRRQHREAVNSNFGGTTPAEK